MKYVLFLLGTFFIGSIFGMNKDKSILVENNSNQILSIAYKDQACFFIEKLLPHHRLVLLSTTPFVVIASQVVSEQYKFPIENVRHHFVVSTQKSRHEGGLEIFDCELHVSKFSK